MKRYEEIVSNACMEGTVDCMEAAVVLAVFQFTQQVFDQGGKAFTEQFKAKFGRRAYDRFMIITGQRRN